VSNVRVDIAAREDEDMIDDLLAAIIACGGDPQSEADSSLGVRVYRFGVSGESVSIYLDAWGVDLAGPDKLVHQILRTMRGD
jgi:hypothetical protein